MESMETVTAAAFANIKNRKVKGFLRALDRFTPFHAGWNFIETEAEEFHHITIEKQYGYWDLAGLFGTDAFTVEKDDREADVKWVGDRRPWRGGCIGKVKLAGYTCEYWYEQMGTDGYLTISLPAGLIA